MQQRHSIPRILAMAFDLVALSLFAVEGVVLLLANAALSDGDAERARMLKVLGIGGIVAALLLALCCQALRRHWKPAIPLQVVVSLAISVLLFLIGRETGTDLFAAVVIGFAALPAVCVVFELRKRP